MQSFLKAEGKLDSIGKVVEQNLLSLKNEKRPEKSSQSEAFVILEVYNLRSDIGATLGYFGTAAS